MLNNIVETAATIGISGHIRPDGDCVGAVMAMYLYLTEHYPDKKVSVYLETFPDTFRFIKDIEVISPTAAPTAVFDLYICLDCGDIDRLGFAGPMFKRARRTFCIDHHISRARFADENYIDPEASSTCELVFNLLAPEQISTAVAEALYLGIVHDTGVFQHSNVAPATFRAAAVLLEKGINSNRIITDTFFTKSYAQNQILGRTLLESFQLLQGRVIISSVTQYLMQFYEVTAKDLDGIVNQMKNTAGVDVAVFMYELENGDYKVSLRSSDRVDVNAIAAYFGGGGHKRAAGFSMRGTVHDIANNVLKEITRQLNNQPGENE